MNHDAIAAIINGILQAHDPALSVHFNAAEDPQSEDDEFEVRSAGQVLRLASDEPGSDNERISIQCCAWGGGFAVNRYFYRGDDLQALLCLTETNNPRVAADAVVRLVSARK